MQRAKSKTKLIMEDQILISIPADKFWAKMEKMIEARTQKITDAIIDSTKSRTPKLYSLSKAGKILHRKPETIKKLIESGVLRATDDGKITQQAIDDYLKQSS